MALSSSQPMPIPEPMNASPHHSKVKVSITLADRLFVAGGMVAGKVEMECRADKGLGIGVIMVELFAVQELTSRDHSATSTFIHSKRIFQGPGLPPSNAVQAHPQPGCPPLPPNYYQARRGLSTFLFRIPIPEGSPSTINFGSGLAKVRYELRASVGVVWKDERRLVVDKQALDVIAAYPYEDLVGLKEPEGVVIGENGKFWVHGKLVGPVVVAGESACIELHVKNHSNKKNTGLSLTLNRTLILPGASGTGKQALELTDTLTHVPFRGPDYIVPPGVEGVANLVFDVPKHSRGVRGGTLEGDEVDPPRHTESLFEIRCTVDIKMTMGFGNKDLFLSVPISIVHPKAVPRQQSPVPVQAPPLPVPAPYPYDAPYQQPHYPTSPASLVYPPPVTSPLPFSIDHQHNQVWIPPPMSPVPFYHPPTTYMAVPPVAPYLVRPASAGGNITAPDPYSLPVAPYPNVVSGLPPPSTHSVAHIPGAAAASPPSSGIPAEEGKGQRAQRVSHHLRVSSRTRSVSPQSHRFPASLTMSPGRDGPAPATPVRGRGLPQPPVASPLAASSAVAMAVPVSPSTSLSPIVPARSTSGTGIVHSPRPQLTPKTSFSMENGARPKSQRVEDLERMATQIALQGEGKAVEGRGGLNGVSAALKSFEKEFSKKGEVKKEDAAAEGAGELAEEVHPEAKEQEDVNKTLPAPPVPTRNKPVSAPLSPVLKEPVKPKLDTLFQPTDEAPQEAGLKTPLPPRIDHKTPPTPTLNAVLPTRYPRAKLNNFLGAENTESGLDALERKLLAQVGTRKFDSEADERERNAKIGLREFNMGGGVLEADEKNIAESVTRVGAGGSASAASPINIPAKVQAPEPLNDESAISSLTLGNHGIEEKENDRRSVDGDVEEAVSALGNEARLDVGGGNDSDVEARTHRGGSVSGDEERRRSWNPPTFPLLMEDEAANWSSKATGSKAKREEAEAVVTAATAFRGSTPTKLSDGSRKSGKSRDRERRSGKKRDKGEKAERAKTRTDAKGRVAAWLGGIDPEQPPEEEVIPPSPSVARRPDHFLGAAGSLPESPPPSRPKTPSAVEAEKIHDEKDVSTAPNPRSSGFLPVGTVRKDTFKGYQISTARTVVEESRKVADLWASEASPKRRNEIPAVVGIPDLKDDVTPRIPFAIPTRGIPPSIRTDRRVSPPSKGGVEIATLDAKHQDKIMPSPRLPPPISESSSSSRNVWQLPDPVPTVKSKRPPQVPAKPLSAAAPAFAPSNKKLPPSDPEVKYDVRSARGGRGGKVASVTAMWASVAAGISQSQSQQQEGPTKPAAIVRASEAQRKLNHNGRFAGNGPSVSAATSAQGGGMKGAGGGPHLPGKIALPGLAASATPGGISSRKTAAAGSVPVLSGVEAKPSVPPKPKPVSSTTSGVGGAGAGAVPKKLPAAGGGVLPPPVGRATSSGGKSTSPDSQPAVVSPAPGLFAGDYKARTPGKTTPNTNLSTPSTGEPGLLAKTRLNLNNKLSSGALRVGNGGAAATAYTNNPIPRPATASKPAIVKSTSVPAVISSSHAIPVLSSTASLARPAGANRGAPRLTAVSSNSKASPASVTVGGLSRDKTPNAMDDSSSLGGRKANGSTTPSSSSVPAKLVLDTLTSTPGASALASPVKSPAPELAFGQARLRDLIKKYQTQAT